MKHRIYAFIHRGTLTLYTAAFIGLVMRAIIRQEPPDSWPIFIAFCLVVTNKLIADWTAALSTKAETP